MKKEKPSMQAYNLRMIRNIHGLSTIELADILGVSDSTVSRNETGRPTAKYIERFCAELHVSPGELVSGWLNCMIENEPPAIIRAL